MKLLDKSLKLVKHKNNGNKKTQYELGSLLRVY